MKFSVRCQVEVLSGIVVDLKHFLLLMEVQQLFKAGKWSTALLWYISGSRSALQCSVIHAFTHTDGEGCWAWRHPTHQDQSMCLAIGHFDTLTDTHFPLSRIWCDSTDWVLHWGISFHSILIQQDSQEGKIVSDYRFKSKHLIEVLGL